MKRLSTAFLIVLSVAACKGAPEDEALKAAVHRALIEEQEVNLLEVDAEVERGVVYLTGETRDRERKVHAEEVARTVPGVKDVVNKIGIEP